MIKSSPIQTHFDSEVTTPTWVTSGCCTPNNDAITTKPMMLTKKNLDQIVHMLCKDSFIVEAQVNMEGNLCLNANH